MRINNNMMAMNTHRQLGVANNGGAKSMEKLSSGLRINRAGDDAAGLSISEKMRGQIRGLNQASSNAQDGISMLQTAEGALNETQAILQRMRELAVQSSTDTNVDTLDREAIDNELKQLTEEIDRIGNTTEFNTKKLLNGDMSKIESGTKVTTTDAKNGKYIPNFAVGTTWTGQTGKAPVINNGTPTTGDNKIAFSASTVDAANPFSWDINTTKTNTISIERSGDDIKVSINATDMDGEILAISNDKMALDASTGKYVYDANGVKFEISKAEFEKFTDGAKLEIDLNKYDGAATGNVDLKAATVGTVSDYTQTLAGSTTFGSFSADGIEVDTTNANWINGVQGIKITGTTLEQAGVGSLKIELLDETGATIATEELTGAAAGGNIAYDAHGIKFGYTIADTSDLNLKVMFDTTTTEKTTTETIDKSATLQIGANKDQTMSVSVGDMRAKALGVDKVSLATGEDARKAITTVNDAINKVSTQRSELGAFQNRLEHTIKNLDNSSENLQAAEARIRDVDMAKEMMEQTKQNILAQASTAMLAQANQAPQAVLQLLR